MKLTTLNNWLRAYILYRLRKLVSKHFGGVLKCRWVAEPPRIPYAHGKGSFDFSGGRLHALAVAGNSIFITLNDGAALESSEVSTDNLIEIYNYLKEMVKYGNE